MRTALLVGFVFAALSLGAAQPPKAHDQPDQTNDSAPAPTRVAVTDFPAPKDTGCEDRKPKRDSDLCAQWEAADAAREAASYSLAAVILSAFGTAFLLGSLIQAWRTSRAELRAYVNVEAAQIGDGTQNLEAPRPFIGGIWVIKNTGNTPAYSLRHWGEIAICTFEDQDSLVTPKPLADLPGNTLPKEGTNRKFRQMPKATKIQIAAFRKGTSAVFVYGRIEYRDVFGREHFTDYRLHYAGVWPPPPDNSLFFSDRGNESD